MGSISESIRNINNGLIQPARSEIAAYRDSALSRVRKLLNAPKDLSRLEDLVYRPTEVTRKDQWLIRLAALLALELVLLEVADGVVSRPSPAGESNAAGLELEKLWERLNPAQEQILLEHARKMVGPEQPVGGTVRP